MDQTGSAPQNGDRSRHGYRSGEPHDERYYPAAHGVSAAQPQADRYPGEGAEFGTHDHRADHGDRRIRRDPDRREDARQDHECHERPGQRGVLARTGDDLIPDNGVGTLARGVAFGLLHASANRGVDPAPADRPTLVDAQLAQITDDLLNALADQVDLVQVTGRLAGHPREHDEIGCPGLAAQYLRNPVAEIGRAHHAHMQHRHAEQSYPGPIGPAPVTGAGKWVHTLSRLSPRTNGSLYAPVSEARHLVGRGLHPGVRGRTRGVRGRPDP